MKIELLQGKDAENRLADPSFAAQWQGLVAQCPWATAFQGWGFCSTWYRTYRQAIDPVLVVARDAAGGLCGLLPLALDRERQKLVVCGSWHAEYQCWICQPEVGDRFARDALETVRRHFPSHMLRLEYLPPAAPVSWLATAGSTGACLLKSHRRPLLKFGDGKEISTSLSKGSNKSRLRRLEKVGALQFKRITDPADFQGVFDQIIQYYDCRRLAVNGSSPFANDILKKPFHEAMLNVPGLLHVTVLQVGDTVASAHLGALGAHELQLGLMAHNPFLAKHSPGKFHILFLAKMLMEEGISQLDLTAGGDPYKERFANDADEVHTLTVFPSAIAQQQAIFVAKGLEAAKKTIRRFGVTPGKVKSVAERARRMGPIHLPALVARKTAAWAIGRRAICLYSSKTARAAEFSGSPRICRDSLADLLAYQPDGHGLTRQEFISDALHRIEKGHHVYTCCEQGRLLHFAWLMENGSGPEGSAEVPGWTADSDETLVYEFVRLGDVGGSGIEEACLHTMLRDAACQYNTSRMFVAVREGDEASRTACEASGLAFDQSIIEQAFFGRKRRWIESAPAEPKPVAVSTTGA